MGGRHAATDFKERSVVRLFFLLSGAKPACARARQHPMLEYASTSPPARLPWLVDEAGAHVDYRKHRLFPSAKNHLTWRPCEAGGSRALVVIGDSYADDVDMGFETWPSQLARALPATLVNTARGGSRTPAALEQLARADRRLPTEQFPVGERLLVVHTGGNDLLLALLLPPLTLLLWLDVLALSGASAGLRPPSRRGTSTTRPRRVRDMCIGLWSPPARPARLSLLLPASPLPPPPGLASP